MKGFRASFSQPTTPPRRRNAVVTYAEARDGGNADLKIEMEKLLDPIDRAPDSAETIAAYGSAVLNRFEALSYDVRNFFDSLPKTGAMPRDKMLVLEKLGLARVELTREMNLYLGAAPEALRRYNEEYIPAATSAFNDSGDPEEELQLKDTLRRKEDVISRISLLESTRALSVITAQFMRQALDINDMGQVRGMFNEVMGPSLHNWRQNRAGAGILQLPSDTSVQLPRAIKVRKPLSFKQPAPI